MLHKDQILHLARPPQIMGFQHSTAPINVLVHPQAVFAIIDYTMRRNPNQERVIGTLLGTRNEDGSEVEIRNCYAVPHNETHEYVEVDLEADKHLLNLHLHANPREVLVGWFATSCELNTVSALIQNFYGKKDIGTWPHPAVHLTLHAEPGKDIEIRTYISAPVGVSAERNNDNALFIPVPHEIQCGELERSGLELISSAKTSPINIRPVPSDLETLETSLSHLLNLLERVSVYVNSVIDEEALPSQALGQFLLNTLSLSPNVDMATIERDFNKHIQDVLAISYLANTIRAQVDISNRLVAATANAPATATTTATTPAATSSDNLAVPDPANQSRPSDRHEPRRNAKNRNPNPAVFTSATQSSLATSSSIS